MPKASFFVVAILLVPILIALSPLSVAKIPASAAAPFIFASMGDGQEGVTYFTTTVNQIATLNPNIIIFNGDLEIDGVTYDEIDPMVDSLKNAGLFNRTFLVRGNHDNRLDGSETLWEHYFETSPNIKVLPDGVTDYVSLSSSVDYLTYSFIYGNAMFIGLDVPGNVQLITSEELTFLDTRLSYAESQGLFHAFIYFHGPLYCVGTSWCDCTAKSNASCTPSALVTVLNKHPIVSATFHGHEHFLSWTHMSSTRVSRLTSSFEQFLTSPAGSYTDNDYLYPARTDYTYMNMGDSRGFATVSVDGDSFTVNFYKVGTSAPVWSKMFTNNYHPTPTATSSLSPTLTFTSTATFTLTFTPTPTFTITSTPSQTPIPESFTHYLPLIIKGN